MSGAASIRKRPSGDLMSAAGARAPERLRALDALRGLAIIAMVAFHFSFDLSFFRVTRWDFYHDAFWLHARTFILSSFLLIAGVSLVLAARSPQFPTRFWRHVGTIAACALVVSVASYLVFPESWIWFGVLHAMALSLILARPLFRRPGTALLLGIAVIIAGNLIAHPAFDNRPLGWVGFMTAKPRTEDYVPLFPWFGVLLLGVAAGRVLLDTQFRPIAAAEKLPRVIAWLGRHSLAIYMIHQPILIGLLFLAFGPPH